MTESDATRCARAAKAAAPTLAAAPAETRTAAILAAAAAIDAEADAVCEANARDMARGREAGMPGPLLDRLLLDRDRLAQVTSAMAEVAAQEDPLGAVEGGRVLASGISLTEVSVPIGVVAIIYEARPNVTADSIALCLRSGNACVLRGGSAAMETCAAMAAAARRGLDGPLARRRALRGVHRALLVRRPHARHGPRGCAHPPRRRLAHPHLRGGVHGPRHRDRHG